MLADPKLLNLVKLRELEDDMGFTLSEHYKERIQFHTKMLSYYLNESRKA